MNHFNSDFYPHFTHDEMDCQCGCAECPSGEFMNALEYLRVRLGAPMRVISGSRCPRHDANVHRQEHPDFEDEFRFGPHTVGACDINIYGPASVMLLELVFPDPTWKGIGLRQHGPPSKRIVHLDIVPGERRVWTYP